MIAFVKAAVETGARTLPGRAYASEEVLRAEQERIFYKRWMCVGRSEQIAQPGDYMLAQVGEESLIVLRDRSGVVRAFYNVCRHRGTRLCSAEHGRFSGSIQCPYHAWTYGLDGRLLAARHMQNVPDFDKADYPLYTAKLAEWEGFLFVNLASEPEPFEHAFAPMTDRVAPWQIGSLRVAHRIEYDVQANWKLLFENYSECYHCSLIHPALDKLSPSNSGRNDLSEGPFLGGYMELNDHVDSMTMSGGTARPPVGVVVGENLQRVYYYTLMPNMLLSLHPDYVMSHIMSPLSAGRTRVVCEWLFAPETIAQPGFDPSDAVEFWDMTNRQDWHVCELTQLGVTSRAYTPGPYANEEGLLDAFDREYERVMEE